MIKQKTTLVLGAGGFIGSHLVKRLKQEGYWVVGVDLKHPEFSPTAADQFIVGDLADWQFLTICMHNNHPQNYQRGFQDVTNSFDEVYQLAADMGGAGYIFSGENDAAIMTNSAAININVLNAARMFQIKKIFFSSSACIYPKDLQHSYSAVIHPLKETDAYPADPDSCYGWEKLFSEQLYTAYHRNYDMDIRIARFHNIFGPQGTYKGGREKAPAAICRKVAEAADGGSIEIWGNGNQLRSFLYIDEYIEGVRRLMNSEYTKPLNIGSSQMVSINDLFIMAREISGKNLGADYIKEKPTGVAARNSDNTRIQEVLGWQPSQPLMDGLVKTYYWINKQVNNGWD